MIDMDVFNGPSLLRVVFLVGTVAAIVFALRAKRVGARSAAWGVMFACWIGALCSGGNLWESATAEAVTWTALTLPAVTLAVASWRLRRGRADAITAEIGLLVLIAFSQWVVWGLAVPVWFLLLAAAFVAAAIPVPSRRIAYGAVALSYVLVAAFPGWLMWSRSGQHPDIPFNDDILVSAVVAGIPILGALAQLLWCVKRRKREA